MTWFLAIAGIALLIVIHEAGHAVAARACGMRVDRFSLFFPPLLVRRRIGKIEYAIGALPFGGYVKIAGMNPAEEHEDADDPELYSNRPIWQRAVVIAAGPAANLATAFLILVFILMVIGVPRVQPLVSGQALSAPAVGQLLAGDRIVAIDGVRGGPAEFVKQTRTHTCGVGTPRPGCSATTPAEVSIVRDGRPMTLRIAPRWDGSVKAMRLGFSFQQGRETVGPITAVARSIDFGWQVARNSLAVIPALGSSEGRSQVSGIVGFSVATERAFAADAFTALELLALLSVVLAVLNLLPLLPLDGGHLLWLLVEKIRGKPLSVETLGKVAAVGLVLVVVVGMISLSNDIGRLGSGGFDTTR